MSGDGWAAPGAPTPDEAVTPDAPSPSPPLSPPPPLSPSPLSLLPSPAAPPSPSSLPGPWAPPVGAPAAVPAVAALSGVGQAERRRRSIGPIGLVDLFDQAMAVIKRHPRRVIATVAPFVIPLQLLAALITRETAADLGGFGGVTSIGSDVQVAAVLVSIATMAVFPWITAALAPLVVADRLGDELPPVGDCIAGALKRAPALTAAWVITSLAKLVLCIPPVMLALMAMFVAVAPVIALEGAGPIVAIRRSWSLCRRRFWWVLWFAIASGLLALGVAIVLRLVPEVVAAGMGDAGWVVSGVSATLIGLITTPFVSIATIYAYLDLRIRTEGMDLDLDVETRFGPNDGARR